MTVQNILARDLVELLWSVKVVDEVEDLPTVSLVVNTNFHQLIISESEKDHQINLKRCFRRSQVEIFLKSIHLPLHARKSGTTATISCLSGQFSHSRLSLS